MKYSANGAGTEAMGLTKCEMIRVPTMLVCRMEIFFHTTSKPTEKKHMQRYSKKKILRLFSFPKAGEIE